MTRITLFVAIVVGMSFAIHKGIQYYEEKMSPLPVYGNEGHVVPEFSFTDQLGREISSNSLAERIWVVDFFFTSCPTICPKMTKNLQSLHDMIRQDESIAILSFTVDPKRDTPERLFDYAESYRADHDNWLFLTGDKDSLYRLGNRGFLLSASDSGGSDLDFIHSENIVLVDNDRKIRGFYKGTDPDCVDRILNDINKIKKKRA